MRLLSRYALIPILALGLLLAVPLLNEHLVPAGDNSTYLILGQALATGQGYKMVSDPRSPDMGLYPPGYPLLLSGVLALTGTQRNLLAGILPCKLLSVVLYLGTLFLIYELLKPRSRALAIAATLLTAVNPHMLFYAVEVGTEIPYLFLSLACLWVFAHYLRKPSVGGFVATVIMLVLAFYVRSIALVMAPAFALSLVIRRPSLALTSPKATAEVSPTATAASSPRFRQALLLLLAVVALEAPWFLWSRSLPNTGTAVGLGRGYFALYFTSDPYGTVPASLSDWVVRLAQNVRAYVFEIWPSVLFPHAERIQAILGPAGAALGLSLSLLLFLGFLVEAWQGHVSEWYAVAFFASCVAYMWAQSRLILPIIPLAIYYFLVGIYTALEFAACVLTRTPPRVLATVSNVPNGTLETTARRAASGVGEVGPVGKGERLAPLAKRITISVFGAACAVLVLSALVAEGNAVRRNLSYGLGRPLADYYQTSPEWSNYLQAMDWIAKNSGADSSVICRKADLMYVVTGHRALEYPYSQDGMTLKRCASDNRVSYIIEDAFKWTGTTTDYLRPALRAWMAAEPQALALVFQTNAPQTRVWRVEQLPAQNAGWSTDN